MQMPQCDGPDYETPKANSEGVNVDESRVDHLNGASEIAIHGLVFANLRESAFESRIP